jgi:hypothetical protein
VSVRAYLHESSFAVSRAQQSEKNDAMTITSQYACIFCSVSMIDLTLIVMLPRYLKCLSYVHKQFLTGSLFSRCEFLCLKINRAVVTTRTSYKFVNTDSRQNTMGNNSSVHDTDVDVKEIDQKTSEPKEDLSATRVFKIPLRESLARQSQESEFGTVPSALYQSILFINTKGFDEEGLYRVPGNKRKADEIKLHAHS